MSLNHYIFQNTFLQQTNKLQYSLKHILLQTNFLYAINRTMQGTKTSQGYILSTRYYDSCTSMWYYRFTADMLHEHEISELFNNDKTGAFLSYAIDLIDSCKSLLNNLRMLARADGSFFNEENIPLEYIPDEEELTKYIKSPIEALSGATYYEVLRLNKYYMKLYNQFTIIKEDYGNELNGSN